MPDELIESARLDDAGEIKIMMEIMIPMAKSTFVTVALLSFISHWNAYFWPLVMTTTERVKPFTLCIDKLKDLDYGLVWPTIMAGNGSGAVFVRKQKDYIGYGLQRDEVNKVIAKVKVRRIFGSKFASKTCCTINKNDKGGET